MASNYAANNRRKLSQCLFEYVEWKSDVLSFSVRYIGRPTPPSSLHKICQMKVKNGPKTGVPESLHSIATKDIATPEIQ